MLKIIYTIGLLLVAKLIMAFNFGEHQYIGNVAINRHMYTIAPNDNFLKFFPLQYINDNYTFSNISKYNSITYGTINGLAGDHSADMFTLETLLSQNSYLQKVIALHNQYILQGYTAAPDKRLLKLDKKYALLALKNMSHFYEYGKSWDQHFSEFDTNNIKAAVDKNMASAIYKVLNKTNALLMYASLHSSALYLAHNAGKFALQSNNIMAKEHLYYAYLCNAYADHFLQDAFSSGHLLVKRTIYKSVINNKSLHDFYSQYGTKVVNAKGEVWTAYGDNLFNKEGKERLEMKLTKLQYENINDESKRVITAVQLSIAEIKEAFDDAMHENDIGAFDFISKPANNFLERFKALQLVPLPYKTKLTQIIKETITTNMKQANEKPFLRNFIRSRTANYLVMGVTQGTFKNAQSNFQGLEFRINAGMFYKNFGYNKNGSKKGKIDKWLGYTTSYSSGFINTFANDIKVKLFKVGLRLNVDFWLTNKAFVGLFMYNEAGIMKIKSKAVPIYSPQLGIQLGSFLNINYYNIPPVLRVPLQLVLPLKFKINATYANAYKPIYAKGVELDVIF